MTTLLASPRAFAQVEWIAHRGESADAPENTLAAFQLAWERKVPAIELDVHLSRDGELVVIHDADTERTAGTKRVVVQTDAKDLLSLDVGSWKGAAYQREALPTLAEALATIPKGARCFIEIKVGPEAIAPLVKVVRDSGKEPAQLAVISFKAESIAEAKQRLPELKAYYVSSFKEDKGTGRITPSLQELIETAKKIGADGLDLSYKGPIDRAYVEAVKAAGLEFYVWTVDDAQIARKMIEAGVDGITSNRPAALSAELANPAP